ncbi:MAG: selenium metabolism hydrolase [Stygiobacter sp. RIFOXYC12_FULL_38_8]|nr:MAG: selenium metabolism hydrolase [Stygiobacter sp. GWC2_38_9]OGU80009.1 MAG: selenium metabolism hydrolase [Stygiobacter sp. RIFOXYA12_FULL_38_9]OGV07441.1 MAG: selenium metabolism hydrolase [Stygiobacter sp. RIFOXYB2_FULL_37_11]OGV12274.1 MAG: selenium metabolism hydrolase [Stygiobacter sp. RIFOXYA2_FULL_38_8]OGV13699.1 MAG: selenium metabolism hydrolase [Stygiobacter sp. RIFOXYC2_FULL_38_25]OGV30394.1 MAG: selenium metabolism hydrolase [Stygiobacter sp. RIFOXYC12_FULL_38_8]OGV80083.1 M
MEKSLKEKLFKTVESEKENLFGLIQRLIQIKSYSGEEKEIVEFIVGKMKEYGFDEAYHDGFGNAIGKIGNGPIKIMFDAHIDTVKVTETENWAHPPFGGEIVNGKMYGRGVVDEKPAMAGFMIAGKVLKQVYGNDFPFTLYVVGSVLEEDADGYPLYHIIQNEKIKPDYVVLGEPTNLQVYRGQRGRMELKITATGKSAHGAHNHKGINAIYKLQPILAEIEKLDKKLKPKQPLAKGSITVSQITSKAPSTCSVADYCQIHLDRRMTIGENKKTVVKELQEIIKKHKSDAKVSIPNVEGKSWKGTEFSQEAYFPTWVYDEKHPLVDAAMKTSKAAMGKAKSGVWSFSTNGVATAGHFGIPTIGFAPGREELAHSSKEELVLNDLLKATKFYSLFPFELANRI